MQAADGCASSSSNPACCFCGDLGTGSLAWISDPVDGSRHDNYCQEESGVLLTMDPKNWIGDKGYIGNHMITPFRKTCGRRAARLAERVQYPGQ